MKNAKGRFLLEKRKFVLPQYHPKVTRTISRIQKYGLQSYLKILKLEFMHKIG